MCRSAEVLRIVFRSGVFSLRSADYQQIIKMYIDLC